MNPIHKVVVPENFDFVNFLDSIIDNFKEYKGDRITCYYISPKYGQITFVIHIGV